MTVMRSLALLMSLGSLAPPAASKTFSRRVPVKLAVVVPWPAWNETLTVSAGSCFRSSMVNDRGVPTRPLIATSGENVAEATAGMGAARRPQPRADALLQSPPADRRCSQQWAVPPPTSGRQEESPIS